MITRRSWLSGVTALAGGLGLGGAGCRTQVPASGPSGASAAGGSQATLLVRGASILTLDPDRPQAEALAVAGDEIVAVGTARELEAWRGPATKVLDLGGGLVTPGLQDAHAHLTGLGASLEQVDLRGAQSIDEVVARLKAHDAGGAWLTGRGWDQNLWPDAVMPTHDALSAAFPDRPVWLRRVDGHAGWANLAAMKAAGITADTAAPAGGEILRGKGGAPTGVLVDAAMGLMSPPPATADDVRRYVLAGQTHAMQRGLTGVHDMGVGKGEDAVYRALVADDAMKLRLTAYASESWLLADLAERSPTELTPQTRYALIGVKLYADGALGSRGAALLQPYSDRAGHTGLMQHEPGQLEAACAKAKAGGWQAATHAIGDAANRAVIDAYVEALGGPERAAASDHRWRIEHAQIVDPSDIARFAEHGIVASMQPTHATSDMPWVPARIGDARLAGAYAWRRFLDAGAALTFGSDFPVERVDVTHGLHAAVTRQDAQGNPAGGWLPDQRLSLQEAVAAFSKAAAFAGRREGHLGVLRPGMQADLTCFGEDLLAADPAAIRDATIAATVIAGEVVHEG